MMTRHLCLLSLLVATAALAQPLSLPAEPGQSLSLAPDDTRLELQKQETWTVVAPALSRQQVVLHFRARIDNPGTIGSTNLLRIELNGQTVGLKTPRRQMRLLNKSNKFAWSDPPTLNWFIPPSQWRLVYAPNFDILKDRQYYGLPAYEFTLDVSDLIKPGENALTFTHTGNPDIARNARSDLAIIFRDLKLEVRQGPGVLAGEPPRPPRFRPFTSGQSRSRAIRCTPSGPRSFEVRTGDDIYVVISTFGRASIQAEHPWRHRREVKAEPKMGRILIQDHFTNPTDQPQPVHVQHELHLMKTRSERVNFGGIEDPNLEEINRPTCPYLFMPHDGRGVGLVAYDDVLRTHAMLAFDDERQAGAIRDDWFGLPPHGEYTMTWAVYATATDNVFDLVNLIRRDWNVSFPITGGYNFFEPDSILAYDDEKLKQHLDMLNINVTMSQGGWLDFKRHRAGEKNVGHGPIVAGDYYADYRQRLKAACEKFRRLRPGIKCLIYYDTWLVSGSGILEKFADSIYTRADGKPRTYQEKSAFDFPIANVVPTLDNTMGRETLAKIPSLFLDEIGADGLYWDEIGHGFNGAADYAHPDGYTCLTDPKTGEITRAAGAPELASQPFKLALMKAFFDRGAMIVGNSPPGTMTEQQIHFTRFTETDIPHHVGLSSKTWLYSPVSYAGWSTYKEPDVSEADFLRDIKEKLWNANLYLFSSHVFYKLFTRENLASYQYPITVIGLDEGVIVGKERIITLRPGRIGWPGEKWQGELLLFDPDQKIVGRERVKAEKDGCVEVKLQPEYAAVVIRDN